MKKVKLWFDMQNHKLMTSDGSEVEGITSMNVSIQPGIATATFEIKGFSLEAPPPSDAEVRSCIDGLLEIEDDLAH